MEAGALALHGLSNERLLFGVRANLAADDQMDFALDLGSHIDFFAQLVRGGFRGEKQTQGCYGPGSHGLPPCGARVAQL